MTSLSAADIVTKLKVRASLRSEARLRGQLLTRLGVQFLFSAVVCLFTFMNGGAVIGYYQDASERKRTLHTLLQPALGFTELPGDLWTWRCTQSPLTRAVQAPAGSAALLARVLGLPWVRLRCALPELLLPGSVRQALGRRAGMSVLGLNEEREEHDAAMVQLTRAMACFGGQQQMHERIPAFDTDGAKGVSAARVSASRSASLAHVAAEAREQPEAVFDANKAAESMVCTALVLAFFTNAHTLSVEDLARRIAAASAHFCCMELPGCDHTFDTLLSCFLVMLSPGNLSSRTKWLPKARLWRFILLQRADGGWDMTSSLAFALQAHEAPPPPPLPPSKFRAVLGALLGGMEDAEQAADDAIDEALASSDEEEITAVEKKPRIVDCPLEFTLAAIRMRLPPSLAVLNDEYNQQVLEEAREEELLRQHLAAEQAAAASAAATAVAAEERVEMAAVAEEEAAFITAPLRAQALQHVPSSSPRADQLADCSAVAVLPQGELMLLRRRGTGATVRPSRPRCARQRVPVERIWCTLLALNELEAMDSSWLMDEEAETQRSCVDHAHDFLDAQMQADPRLRNVLNNSVLHAARKATKDWKSIQARPTGAALAALTLRCCVDT